MEKMVGMDICPKMIKFCRFHHHNSEDFQMEFEVADAFTPSTMLPSWKSNFDLLTTFHTMHWITDQRKALESCHFCLKDDGIALIQVTLKCDAWIQSE